MQVKDKLRNITIKRNLDFNTLLRLYMYDRFIERLAVSKYRDNFILKDTKYEEYLADNIFCNDRRITQYNPNNENNLGYGKNTTVYIRAFGPWSAPF